jgi:hypothetical protein
MKRIVLLISALALAVAPPALAKGPAGATIAGPGLQDPVRLDAHSAMRVMEQTGFWDTATHIPQSGVLVARPKGDLGPKYVVTYELPRIVSVSYVRQEVYPFANGGPVTHVAAGQELFDRPTTGGWFRAATSLRRTLASHGVRRVPKTNASSGVSAAWMLAPLAALALAAVPLARRRR